MPSRLPSHMGYSKIIVELLETHSQTLECPRIAITVGTGAWCRCIGIARCDGYMLRRVSVGLSTIDHVLFSSPTFYILMNRRIPVAFFAFGSTFLGYAFDVSKWMYQQSRPNSERPKMTRNNVITGRPSACTDRSAVGVRIGASHSKAIVDGAAIGEELETEEGFCVAV
jgi:hypothetical protein